MKKLLVILLIIGVYLNRSYSYFYSFLSQKHLLTPSHGTKTIIGSNLNKTIKYIALGDSLTAGVGVLDYKDSYPYLIAQKLSTGQNKVELFNFAVAGATSQEVFDQQIPQIITLQPEVVTLLIGVNDIHNLVSAKKFESNYRAIVAEFKKTNAKVYLLSLPYLYSSKITYFPYNFILDYRTQQFNGIIKKIATSYGLTYLDLYQVSKSNQFYSEDQFHPSSIGYSLWATYILGTLNP